MSSLWHDRLIGTCFCCVDAFLHMCWHRGTIMCLVLMNIWVMLTPEMWHCVMLMLQSALPLMTMFSFLSFSHVVMSNMSADCGNSSVCYGKKLMVSLQWCFQSDGWCLEPRVTKCIVFPSSVPGTLQWVRKIILWPWSDITSCLLCRIHCFASGVLPGLHTLHHAWCSYA